MRYTITYPSSPELAQEYSASPVPLTETDAIIIKGVDSEFASVADIGGNTQGTLYINFVKGNLTKVVIRTYGSYLKNPTDDDWYQEVIEKDDPTTLGLVTLGEQYIELSANAKIAYHFPIGAFKAYKITVQGYGTSNTNSSITLNCALRVN